MALLAAVIIVGTAGYIAIEHWSWFDAFYMTITTITTIGSGEPARMSVAAKVWTIGVVAIGFGVLTYTLLRLLTSTLEGLLEVIRVLDQRLRFAGPNTH
jgi:voltage-gated potassium channel